MRRRVGEVRCLRGMRPARTASQGHPGSGSEGEEGGEQCKQEEGLRSVTELCPLPGLSQGLLLTHTGIWPKHSTSAPSQAGWRLYRPARVSACLSCYVSEARDGGSLCPGCSVVRPWPTHCYWWPDLCPMECLNDRGQGLRLSSTRAERRLCAGCRSPLGPPPSASLGSVLGCPHSGVQLPVL